MDPELPAGRVQEEPPVVEPPGDPSLQQVQEGIQVPALAEVPGLEREQQGELAAALQWAFQCGLELALQLQKEE